MLIPMYFIIGIWGGANRLYAAIKFFIYTMAGSLLMLVAIVVMAWKIAADHGHSVVRLRAPAGERRHAGAGGALALRRLRAGLRHQGPDLPAAHLAARRPRRGAHGGQRAAGGGHAQDRHLRLPPVRGAVLSRGGLLARGDQPDGGAGGDRHHLRCAGGDGAARHQEAGGLLLGEPPRASSCWASGEPPSSAYRAR